MQYVLMDRGVKLLAEEGGFGNKVETKNGCSCILIAIAMSNPMDKNPVHLLELPVETQLEILRQLIGFQGDQVSIDGDPELIETTMDLKNIRL